MAWVYLCCSRGHIYRRIKVKTSEIKSYCPYCGRSWKFKTTKKRWDEWRSEYYGSAHPE